MKKINLIYMYELFVVENNNTYDKKEVMELIFDNHRDYGVGCIGSCFKCNGFKPSFEPIDLQF